MRLLGVGVTGLADYTQEDLFAQAADERAAAGLAADLAAVGRAGGAETGGDAGTDEGRPEPGEPEQESAEQLAARRWPAGHDVRHDAHGHGWVQGSGVGRVTVRFEEPESAPGRVRTFRIDDPALRPADPLPLVRDPADYSSWPASLPKSRSGAVSSGGESRP